MNSILILVCLIYFILLGNGLSDSTFQCTSTNGQYPDPTNCKKYYICWEGQANHETCSGSTMFDTRGSICSASAAVNCAARPVPDANGNVYVCPSPYGIFNVSTTPVAQDYYYCDNNVPSHLYCPCGTVFENYDCVVPFTTPRSTPAPRYGKKKQRLYTIPN